MATYPRDDAWRDLGSRVGATVALVPAAAACAWFGGAAFDLLILGVAGLVIREWCRLVFRADERMAQTAAFAVGCLAAFACARSDAPGVAVAVMVATTVVSTGLAGFRGRLSVWRVVGAPYVILPLLAMFYLRHDPMSGRIAVLWLFAVVWSTDISAYFAGRSIGGPRLSPVLSPGKTWAGFVGGMVGAAVAGALVAHLADLPGVAGIAALGSVTAAVSQIGDIFESAAKRRFDAKDSGALIPGHGGILDRVDGLLFAAVFCAGIGLMRHGDVGLVARFLH